MLPGWFEGQMGALCHYGGQATACGGGHIVIERTLSRLGVEANTESSISCVRTVIFLTHLCKSFKCHLHFFQFSVFNVFDLEGHHTSNFLCS